jgi:hypothetical protein
MSLVKELKRLMQTNGLMSGRVTSVSGTNITVSTASGQIEVSANGNLYVGDLVTVDAGRATKEQRGGDATVYFV